MGWEAIRTEVLRRIRTKVWPLGAAIPHEEQLAQEFGCARATVNRALRDLADQGVLERRRKGGTRVAAMPVRRAILEIPVIRLEVEALGAVYTHQILGRAVKGTMGRTAALGLTGYALHLETLHLADGVPYVHEARVLNTQILPPTPDFVAISANEWLVRNVTYATGEIAFSAETDAQAAQALGVDAGAALFVTERVTFDAAGRVLTRVILAHAPGYQLRTQM